MRAIKNEPFFLYLPYVVVHGGHVVPAEDKARWKEKMKDKKGGMDPGEHENLASRHPEKVSDLKTLMEIWMKQTGARDLSPNPAYDPARPLFNTRDEAIQKE